MNSLKSFGYNEILISESVKDWLFGHFVFSKLHELITCHRDQSAASGLKID